VGSVSAPDGRVGCAEGRTEPEKNSRLWAGVREEVGVVMGKRGAVQCGESWVDGVTVFGAASVVNPVLCKTSEC
jgi:hypothetical protein